MLQFLLPPPAALRLWVGLLLVSGTPFGDTAWIQPARGQTVPPETRLPAGNAEVARVMEEFKGRGDLGDGSKPRSPSETVAALQVPDDLTVELVAGEPDIAQPLHVTFDFRGRMWVTEYRQYPFPAGLKVVRYDQHLRAVFDRVPQPPPHHTPGRDRITMFEDLDGDGRYDSQRCVIDGLNIATSCAVTPEGIWVLNPPYLLFYPDSDHDAQVDGPPVVHLEGFGLEDTHSVENSLQLGPDGWLYAASGSTSTAAVRAPLSAQPARVTRWQGQGVWRYHPRTHDFEIFAEGGGNTFSLEIDSAGLTFSGTNYGNTRGMFYPQGSYGVKSWGKHGPLTNPYAFGFFQHLPSEGDGRRFTQGFVRYQDNQLPERYHDQLIAINPLQKFVVSSRLLNNESTFRTVDFENTIKTDDSWFRPVHVAVGPDGLVYVVDWYDTRLTHVDPRDNWHKSSGRIYRLVPKQRPAADRQDALLPSRTRFDLTTFDDQELLRLLEHPSRTLRFRVLDVLAARASEDLDRTLAARLRDPQHPARLEVLWLLGRRDALDSPLHQDVRLKLLRETPADADLRRWVVRLCADPSVKIAPDTMQDLLPHLRTWARTERDLRVRSQIASTAKRLPVAEGLPIVLAMLEANAAGAGMDDADDPHLPLLMWWAIEQHAVTGGETLLDWLAKQEPWSPLLAETIVPRLMQRWAAEQSEACFRWCARLLELAPEETTQLRLLSSIEEAFAGRTMTQLPAALERQMAAVRRVSGKQDLALRLRQGEDAAIKAAIEAIADSQVGIGRRRKLITTLGELRLAAAKPTLQRLIRSDRSVAIRRAALSALGRFDDPQIGPFLAGAYQSAMDDSTDLRDITIGVLGSRPAWATVLLGQLDAAKIPAERVPVDVVLQMQAMEDPRVAEGVERYWGQVRPTSSERRRAIDALKNTLATGRRADLTAGKKLFAEHCGKCHKLFGEGGQVGPDLTGYERSNRDFLAVAVVDPSAGIREEYTAYRVVTDEGRVQVGLLEEQSPQTVTLRTADGQKEVIDRNTVQLLQASPVSLMPEQLLQALTDQQIVDLFGYLQSSGAGLD